MKNKFIIKFLVKEKCICNYFSYSAFLSFICVLCFLNVSSAKADRHANSMVGSMANELSESKIEGTVFDNSGQPIIGANVMNRETKKGTVTDLNGKFSIIASSGDKLDFSYMGFLSETITIKNSKNIHVILKEDTKNLDEVVVVGYGVQKKVNLSGSVGVVSSETLENRPVNSVSEALQGAVANLNVTLKGGQATSQADLNIRGFTSLNGGQPLIVIDGVVSDNEQFNRMNSADIKSISVLKDAASCAIYGSRAAYGVILVTTKRGSGEKINVTYNNNFNFRSMTKKPEYALDPYTVVTIKNIMGAPWNLMYTQEQVDYAKQISENPGMPPYLLKSDGSFYYLGQTDWVDEAYRDFGFSTEHSINLSASTKRLSYYVSGSYKFQDGMLTYGNDKFNNYNLRTNLDFKIFDWWKISNNNAINFSDYDQPTYLGSNYYWEVTRNPTTEVPKNSTGTWTPYGGKVLGRLAEGGRSESSTTNAKIHFSTDISFFKDIFGVRGNFAFNRRGSNNSSETLPVIYYYGNKTTSPRYHDEISNASRYSFQEDHITYEALTYFTKTFNQKHYVNAILGFNQEEYTYNIFRANRKELITSTLPSINLATGDMNVSEQTTEWAIRGAFLRLNYIFNNKYIFEFNGRYDGTSRFPKNNRFVFNPSGSVAWIVSKENFFSPLSNIVSYLKLRGSYGSLGNQDVGAYSYIPIMSSGKLWNVLDGKQPLFVREPGLVSGNLTWEKVSTANVGIDVNFLQNRLVASADIYRRDTRDMLTLGKKLPAVLGANEPQENASDLKTKGWELTLGWKDSFKAASKRFNYYFNFILSDSRSWITKFDNPSKNLGSHYVGEELGEIWGAKTLGFFTSEADIKNHADQSLVTSYPGIRPLGPGDLKFADLNGDGIISRGKRTADDPGDYFIIGNTTPRYNYSFTLGGDWNGIDFKVFFQGVGKRDYMPGVRDLYFWGIYAQPWTNITKGNLDHWSEENPNGYFPRKKAYLAEKEHVEAGVPQTRYLQNAAYLRLKNLSIGYTFPRSIMQKINLNRLRIYFSGDNLFVASGLVDQYNVDPEGLGGTAYPLQRSYSFGMNVSF
ncbi:MAG: SusC/RagA family TonB-linked outer membrane protein [Turicibacter sp.]